MSTVTKGNASALLHRQAKVAASDQVIREILVEAFGKPVAERARQNIQKRTGKTAEAIDVINAPSSPGRPAIAVGIRGPRYPIGGFLERGTSKMTRKPWLTPAHDAEAPQGGARSVALLKERLK